MPFDPIAFAIGGLASFLVSVTTADLQKRDGYIRLLTELNLHVLKDDFEILYKRALVERRRAGARKEVLDLFRDPMVVTAFHEAWKTRDLSRLERDLRAAVGSVESGDEVKARDIDVTAEGREFYDTFRELVAQVRSPASQEEARMLEDIHDAVVPNAKPPNETELLRAYLTSVVAATERIDIQGIGSKPGAGRRALHFAIEDQYTPLKTSSRLREEELSGCGKPVREAVAEPEELQDIQDQEGIRETRVALTALLTQHRWLLIVGQPGGGKTTFLRLISCVLAKDGLDPKRQGRRELLGLDPKESPAIPVFVRLAALKKHLCDDGGSPQTQGPILDFLVEAYGPDTAAVLRKRLDDGHAALLLDGLDEVAEGRARKAIIGVVNAALHAWGQNLIVISSRPYGYQDVAGLEDVATAHIDDFGEGEINEFLDRWVRALYPEDVEEARRDEYLPILQAAIINAPRIRRMARNPVMLTCLCVVHWNELKLPEGKADLLSAVLRWLLNAREDNRKARGFNNTFAEECFKRLALAMTNHAEGKQAIVDLDWAAEQLKQPFSDELGIEGDRARRMGVEFLEAETIESGIVEKAGVGQLRFWHLTFQEHFCGRALAGLPSYEDWWAVIRDRLCDRQWTEVVDHMAGCLASAGRGGLHFLTDHILEPARSGDLAVTARAIGILGRLLRILEVYDYRPPAKLGWEDARQRAEAIFTREGAKLVPVEQRIAAAEALGQAGDPRFDSLEPAMLPIPGREGVLLGKYPVTVGEYEKFIENGGYEQRVCWGEHWAEKQEQGWKEPREWDTQREHPNWPVTGVSWFEGVAYCNWLSRVTGKAFRLSTSDEWEQAATSPKGEYPWGDEEPTPELLNFGDGGIGHPTPVGVYPAGAAPGGHLDMSGNVWEWTQSEYGSRGSNRVIRGGGWGSVARFCRSAFRRVFPPGGREGSLGFRLSRSLP